MMDIEGTSTRDHGFQSSEAALTAATYLAAHLASPNSAAPAACVTTESCQRLAPATGTQWFAFECDELLIEPGARGHRAPAPHRRGT
ncbi:MAG: hypothetical protein IPN53_15775 [Comamonadaceae bacterium]|nr:hypothetical protein [Comamonadaceae bacterium]